MSELIIRVGERPNPIGEIVAIAVNPATSAWDRLSEGLRLLHEQVRLHSAMFEEDRPLKAELRLMLDLVRKKHFNCQWRGDETFG